MPLTFVDQPFSRGIQKLLKAIEDNICLNLMVERKHFLLPQAVDFIIVLKEGGIDGGRKEREQ